MYCRNGACSSSVNPQSSHHEGEVKIDSIRRHYEERGFSEHVTKVLIDSWRPSTQKEYAVYLKKWTVFCRERQINALWKFFKVALLVGARGRKFNEFVAHKKSGPPWSGLVGWDIKIILVSSVTIMNKWTFLKSITRITRGQAYTSMLEFQVCISGTWSRGATSTLLLPLLRDQISVFRSYDSVACITLNFLHLWPIFLWSVRTHRRTV